MKLDVPLLKLGRVAQEHWLAIEAAGLGTTAEEWGADTERQDSFRCHKETQAIPLITGRDMNHRNETAAWSKRWKDLVLPALGPILREQYGEGEIVRSCLVNLLPFATVLEHKDDTEEILLHTHRVHLPIKTNELVDFFVERERFYLEAGYVYEFSNQVFHHVANRSAVNRIHLILDYLERDVLEDFKRRHREEGPKAWKTSYGDPTHGGAD